MNIELQATVVELGITVGGHRDLVLFDQQVLDGVQIVQRGHELPLLPRGGRT